MSLPPLGVPSPPPQTQPFGAVLIYVMSKHMHLDPLAFACAHAHTHVRLFQIQIQVPILSGHVTLSK